MDKSRRESSGKNPAFNKVVQKHENPTRAAVDQLLERRARLKEALGNKQKSKRQWRPRENEVRYSNWKVELQVEKLRIETDEIMCRDTLARAEKNQKIQDDLDNCKWRNKQDTSDFWNHFQEETQKYSNLFVNAHLEYTSGCLKQSVEEYLRQLEKVREKIIRVDQEMADLKVRYGLVELGTNKEAVSLAEIDAVKKTLMDSKSIVRARDAAKETISLLKLKIKQKQHDIDYLKRT